MDWNLAWIRGWDLARVRDGGPCPGPYMGPMMGPLVGPIMAPILLVGVMLGSRALNGATLWDLEVSHHQILASSEKCEKHNVFGRASHIVILCNNW